MGNCFSSNANEPSVDVDDQDNAKSTNDLQLRRDLPKWTSETAITQGALKSKRDEFWETAPKYEGKKEIWDALKAAASAMENGEFGLASVIIETAGIKGTQISDDLCIQLHIINSYSAKWFIIRDLR